MKRKKKAKADVTHAFMLCANGEFVNVKTGKQAIPTRGSVLGMIFDCAVARVEIEAADDQKQKSLFAAPEDWPSGLSADETSYFATYRALSATVVIDGWKPIDFTKDGVLQRGASKLSKNPFMLNHSRDMRDQVGVVKDSTFDVGSGKRLSGINALVEYNVEAATATAPSLIPLVDARMANSVSVSVWYQWEQSHKDMDENDFFWNLGEEVDGELVRLMVTRITSFTELSQVWQGADTTAKRLSLSDDAVADNTEFMTIVTAMAEAPLHDVSASATLSVQPSGDDVPEHDDQKIKDATQEKSMKDKILKALAMLFAVGVDEVDDEFVQDIIVGTRDVTKTQAGIELAAKHKSKQDEYAAQVAERDKEITELKTSLEKSDKDAEIGRTYLKDIRDSAVASYKKLTGDKADEAMLSVIAKADISEAKALTSKFDKELDEKFPATCSSCGKVGSIERASSVDDPETKVTPVGGSEAAETTINL